MEISVRTELPDDVGFLYEVYASTRQEELNATGWGESARETFLRMQFEAQRRGYHEMFPQARFLIILCGGVRAGRMVVNYAPDEIRLVDIALLPCFQNHGFGD